MLTIAQPERPNRRDQRRAGIRDEPATVRAPMLGTISTPVLLTAWAIAAAVAITVFLHATRRGNRHATAWGVGAFLFMIPVLPIYVLRCTLRPGNPRRW
jgi:hypothetical protein